VFEEKWRTQGRGGGVEEGGGCKRRFGGGEASGGRGVGDIRQRDKNQGG